MGSEVVPRKLGLEAPVPTAWRPGLTSLANSLLDNQPSLEDGLLKLRPLQSGDQKRLDANIADYGCTLISLPDKSWDHSICCWTGDFWEVLVDLFSEEEGRSDLVLHVRVFDHDELVVELHDVYVP